jgi:hypothetical protein
VPDEQEERPPEAPDGGPLEREELRLPDGRRLLLYSRREPEEAEG